MNTRQKGLLVLAGLFLIFTLPLLLARYVYHHPHIIKGQTNKGELLHPPLQLMQLPLYVGPTWTLFDKSVLKGKWAIAYVTAAPCDTTCQQKLYKMRQIRTALGKERARVNRLLILTTDNRATVKSSNLDAQLAKDYRGTFFAVGKADALRTFFKLSATQFDNFYVIDPIGNIMLSYPADASPDAIFKDLKHLLKVSQIG